VLSAGETVTLLLPAAAALADLHREQVRHGWVCPEAIWFDARGRPLLGATAVGLAVADVAGLAALGCAAAYAVLAAVPRTGLGLGDAKLAGLLGLLLGWLGWPAVLLGLALPYACNGPVVLGLLLAGRIRRDTALPFGPALLAGAYLAILAIR
jgi:prepilin signal peptidase PulO-like enzyme (type II secretory pathway)